VADHYRAVRARSQNNSNKRRPAVPHIRGRNVTLLALTGVALILGVGVLAYRLVSNSAPAKASLAASTSPRSAHDGASTPHLGPPAWWVPGGATETSAGYNALTCPTKSSCLAVGASASGLGLAATSSDGGKEWSPQKLPVGTSSLDAVACATSTACVAVGRNSVVAESDGGSSWVTGSLPNQITTLSGVACVSQDTCLAVGNAEDPGQPGPPEIFRSTDAGRTWLQVTSFPGGTGGLTSITCPNASYCVAVGQGLFYSSDAGAKWERGEVVGGTQGVQSVSCWSASDCVAVGPNTLVAFEASVPGLALTTTDGGRLWRKAALPAGSGAIDDVICGHGGSCTAIGPNPQGQGTVEVDLTQSGTRNRLVADREARRMEIAGLASVGQGAYVLVGRDLTRAGAPTAIIAGSSSIGPDIALPTQR
jgi:photosystem II stability/assembly factor-like uncharacterized protein